MATTHRGQTIRLLILVVAILAGLALQSVEGRPMADGTDGTAQGTV
jgi:hypothetical protein